MNHRGLFFLMAIAVVASAAVVTTRSQRQRKARRAQRRHSANAPYLVKSGHYSGQHEVDASAQPRIDVSLTSNTVPM